MPWTCAKCKTRYETRNKQRCDAVIDGKICGRKQPKKHIPAHSLVLEELSYADFVAVNGGDFCWIGRRLGHDCGKDRSKERRRFHRDHDHKSGRARGLLCYWHNRFLVGRKANLEEVKAVVEYLERAEKIGKGKDD